MSDDQERTGTDPSLPGGTTEEAIERLPAPEIRDLVNEIWCAVLDCSSLDADASFIHLGGTSIAAMRVCARLSKRLGRHVPVRMIIEHDDLERFATALVKAVDALPVLPHE
ncbi:phosphopantetheine-binding protein [Streptomyces violaceusniger]